MPGALTHTPEQIIQQLLVSLGLGTLPTASGSWPVYRGKRADSPDNAMFVFGSTPLVLARENVHGQTILREAFQVMVRSSGGSAGFTKLDDVKEAFDGVYQNTLHIDSDYYTVHAIHHNGILPLGEEKPETSRYLWSLNATTTVLSGEGLGVAGAPIAYSAVVPRKVDHSTAEAFPSATPNTYGAEADEFSSIDNLNMLSLSYVAFHAHNVSGETFTVRLRVVYTDDTEDISQTQVFSSSTTKEFAAAELLVVNPNVQRIKKITFAAKSTKAGSSASAHILLLGH